MDDGDFDDFDALIEDDANMDMGADDDEMDMMYAMEQEQNAADKDGGAFDEPAAGTQGATQTQAGADDDDLEWLANAGATQTQGCLLYTSPSPRDATLSRMPSSA